MCCCCTHRGQQDARHAGHGQAAVEDLGVHVPGQLLGGGAQAQGVEAVVCAAGQQVQRQVSSRHATADGW